jgi:hypothetical protein
LALTITASAALALREALSRWFGTPMDTPIATEQE